MRRNRRSMANDRDLAIRFTGPSARDPRMLHEALIARHSPLIEWCICAVRGFEFGSRHVPRQTDSVFKRWM